MVDVYGPVMSLIYAGKAEAHSGCFPDRQVLLQMIILTGNW
jgi:hypothetical protein